LGGKKIQSLKDNENTGDEVGKSMKKSEKLKL
jgi:hypothetical protein